MPWWWPYKILSGVEQDADVVGGRVVFDETTVGSQGQQPGVDVECDGPPPLSPRQPSGVAGQEIGALGIGIGIFTQGEEGL